MALDLTCLQTRQAKSRARSSSAVGLRVGDDLEVGLGDAEVVGVLQEEAAGDLLEDAGGVGGVDLDEAEVLLGGEARRGLRG